MKKISKILSVFLVVVTLFSMCSMMAGAISSSSSKSEMLTYYENCLKTTAKKGLIKVDNTWKYKLTGDYSGLSEKDAKETAELNAEFFGTDWNTEEYTSYYYGTSDKDMYIDDQPDTVWMFSVKRRIQEFDFTFKSAKLTTASNGDITITFNLIENWDGGSSKITITTKTSKSGLLKSFVLKQDSQFMDISVNGEEYPMTENTSDTYKVTYKKVPVKSISLSETEVTMGYNDTYTLSVSVNPADATYQDVYCTIDGEETGDMAADYMINEDGTITLTALDKGKTTLTVYSYDGNKKATCEITVEFTFFEMIAKFFRDLFESIRNLFVF